jgi:uncharacterized protein (DUF302 family)
MQVLPEEFVNRHSQNGVASIPSRHTVDQTVANLSAILSAKQVKLFALIDHSGEAEQAGLSMRPTKLLIFGNPKAGTPVMVASPGAALDLPLKLLVWEREDGTVWVSYNEAGYLQHRHSLSPELASNLAVVDALAAMAVK